MPSYNHELFVAEAIQSVLEQGFGDLELIIIDDASSDDSPRIIEEYAGRDPRVRAIYHTENKGIARTVNDGLDAARGRFVALHASDDVWTPDKLFKQLEVLEKDDDLVVWSDAQLMDGEGICIDKTFIQFFWPDSRNRDGEMLEPLLCQEITINHSVIYKRNNLRFDERLAYFNDFLYVLELASRCRFFFIDEPLMKYRLHGQNITLSADKPSWYSEQVFVWRTALDLFRGRISRKARATVSTAIARGYYREGSTITALFAYLRALSYSPTVLIPHLEYWISHGIGKDPDSGISAIARGELHPRADRSPEDTDCENAHTPTVSVVMPCCNHEKYVAESIESVLNQSFGDLELIIIDDASSDDSPRIIEEYAGKDSRVRTIFHTDNKGIARTVNDGLDAARGRYTALQASDDVWLKDKLRKQADLLREDESAVVYCDAQIIDSEGRAHNETFIQYHEAKETPKNGFLFNELLCRPVAHGAIFKSNQERFYEDLKYYNDTLFILGLAASHRFRFVDEALMKYRVHGSNTTLEVNSFEWSMDELSFCDIVMKKYKHLLNRESRAAINTRIARAHYRSGNLPKALRFYAMALLHKPLMIIPHLRYWLTFGLGEKIPYAELRAESNGSQVAKRSR